ncbi:class II aldolase/adducin family protein [Yersinia frederiksenii]|uniref:class II aldolase/adducin family protein n=1 Tax=Yersinia frederiksenii TaxID=29484 RepID=UPI0025AAE54B|nr:class II aldolase/adducin family protein [Yersinia frederiksenii]MDN0118620.1 class II aldolase/adducin family protein [Yersinia frederiksenii]
MSEKLVNLKSSVIAYCTEIGADSLLIQGAGGNVSWKENGILWVKASGTWLAEALEKDIFIPVDLVHMQAALSKGDFTVSPLVSGESNLRPSIETQLHALMPHNVVVHVHSVVVLAHLVCDGWYENFQALLDDTISWTAVDYKKPGAELAEAVYSALEKIRNANVVFLQNHGVVIGGADVEEIRQTLNTIINTLCIPLKKQSKILDKINPIQIDDNSIYSPVSDACIHELAINLEFFSCLDTHWALYPDHVVFLGAAPNTFESIEDFHDYLTTNIEKPELVFIKNIGVFVNDNFNMAKLEQLRCYYDVLSRINELSKVNILNQSQIGELLNWDAEKYRMHVAN